MASSTSGCLTSKIANFSVYTILFAISACATTDQQNGAKAPLLAGSKPASEVCRADNTVTADVVALEQVYAYNRYGAYNSNGLIYALKRDVVSENDDVAAETIELVPGEVRLRQDKRPRPLVLRVNEGGCLKVTFTNLLPPREDGQQLLGEMDPQTGQPAADAPTPVGPALLDPEEPNVRMASMHVTGLQYIGDIRSDGMNVGRNPSGLVAPGETVTYTWYAPYDPGKNIHSEGGYFLYSMGTPTGGEGLGGQVSLGLFGAVNVEPFGSVWYRSQVTDEVLKAAMEKSPDGSIRHTDLSVDPSELAPTGKVRTPIMTANYGGLEILGGASGREIIHGDLTAIISVKNDPTGEDCAAMAQLGKVTTCGESFREFSIIFHDELTVDQAFPQLADEDNPISSLRDGMGINYGASGLGSMVLANRDLSNTASDGSKFSRYALNKDRSCVECKLEEFFLTAWVVGDPAMVFQRDANQRAIKALYPDDPSNVYHSYMGDPVRFRNIHAGPKETHVFHLHAHQWLKDWQNASSTYLDSQTISPGASYTYMINHAGSGNRNVQVGDSIFHCHLYPHFAQGMWAMWRTHDVFEDGSSARNLPDTELTNGSPSPAVVPIPGRTMPLMPTAQFKGYPFYIAGRIGHRPPQPPMDLDVSETWSGTPGMDEPPADLIADGGLPRHVVTGGDRISGANAVEEEHYFINNGHIEPASVEIAKRVRDRNSDPRLLDLAVKLTKATIQALPWSGTPGEKLAMRVHAGFLPGGKAYAERQDSWLAKGYASCDTWGNCFKDTPTATPEEKSRLFRVNGYAPMPGAPFADPCRRDDAYVSRTYRAAYLQKDIEVNKSGWHDPQARMIVLEEDVTPTLLGIRPPEPFFFRANSGECVIFKATNLMPSVLNLDDFQVYSPTDTIGQHIHLVKFDVTASDGSANGWNYEDATLSPDEVRERIHAYNLTLPAGSPKRLTPKTHRIFKTGVITDAQQIAAGTCPADPAKWDEHRWCGAQTTVQRWWADPLLNKEGKDETIRTVFTHDHLGPSSHQQHGLYAALVVEPSGSQWQALRDIKGTTTVVQDQIFSGQRDGKIIRTLRKDGGPTSYRANIIVPPDENRPNPGHRAKGYAIREFALAVADYALLYTKDNQPINPPNLEDHDLPTLGFHSSKPDPEGISTKDPGGQLVNYRNEPIPLRIGDAATHRQRTELKPGCVNADNDDTTCNAGDMAHAFSSTVHGDPATPLLEAFEGDQVEFRLVQGAQEENHIFSVHGLNWLNQVAISGSGYGNAQPIGISEHFEMMAQIASANKAKKIIDYLYESTAADNLWDGQWGLLRAYNFRMKPDEFASLPGSPKPLSRLPYSFGGETPEAVTAAVNALQNVQLPQVREICTSQTATVRRYVVRIDLAKNILGNSKGLSYNSHENLYDPNALVAYGKEIDAGIPVSLLSGAGGKGHEFLDTLAISYQHGRRLEPLILRANAGDCIDLWIDNKLPDKLADGLGEPQSWSRNAMPGIVESFNFNDIVMSSHVGMHFTQLAADMDTGTGSHVGYNVDSTIGAQSGFTRRVLYAGRLHYAEKLATVAKSASSGAPIISTTIDPEREAVEFGIVPMRPFGDVIKHSSHGLIGAFVIEPAGAVVQSDCDIARIKTDCLTSAATVTVTKTNNGTEEIQRFREFVTLYQNDVSLFHNGVPAMNISNEDDSEDTGQKAFNYRLEPMWARVHAGPGAEGEDLLDYDWTDAFSSFRCADSSGQRPCANGDAPAIQDPETPIYTVAAGVPVRWRVAHPGGHPRNHSFTISGHGWAENPWNDDSTVQQAYNKWSYARLGVAGSIGPSRGLNLLIGPAGGITGLPGDYLYRSHDALGLLSGQWGLMRVLPAAACKSSIVAKGEYKGAVCF